VTFRALSSGFIPRRTREAGRDAIRTRYDLAKIGRPRSRNEITVHETPSDQLKAALAAFSGEERREFLLEISRDAAAIYPLYCRYRARLKTAR